MAHVVYPPDFFTDPRLIALRAAVTDICCMNARELRPYAPELLRLTNLLTEVAEETAAAAWNMMV
jgi:hypothetical protein